MTRHVVTAAVVGEDIAESMRKYMLLSLGDPGCKLTRTPTRPSRTRATIHAIEGLDGLIGLPNGTDAAVDTGDHPAITETPSYARDRHIRQGERLAVPA